MANEIIITRKGNFANATLNSLVMEMEDAFAVVGIAAERAKIKAAENLSIISAEELYKEDGFETYIDFAKEVCGLSQSNAYAYAQVGRELRAGRIPEEDANGTKFTFTQLRALCGIKSPEKLAENVASGILSADMTEKEIKEEVDNIQPKKARKQAPEKRFTWEIVGEGAETEDMSKTELIASMAEGGYQFIGEIKNDGDTYIVAIDVGGYPAMWKKGNEVKKVVDAK